MHLVRGMSSTRTVKPKEATITIAKRKELGDALAVYNRQLRQQGRHDERLTFDQYYNYVHGRGKAKQATAANKAPPRYRRETQHIPSLNKDPGIAPKKESIMYSGSLIKGISVLHKSNAVPVMSDEEINDIARMRR
jgi:hypothetical protein